MLHRLIATLAAFVALTALPGGAVLLMGLEDFPTAWLAGTPFDDFTIPAAILAGAVGGTALVAAVVGFMDHDRTAAWGVLAGATLMGFIAGELVLLNDNALWPHWIEWLYIAVGFLMVALGVLAHRMGPRYEVVYRAPDPDAHRPGA